MNDEDEIRITILDDGTIKVETDEIGPANHASAEKFLKLMSELAGGETTIEHKHGQAAVYTHAHGHQHVQQ